MGKRKRTRLAQRHGFDAGGLLGHATGEYSVNVSEQTALAVDTFAACVRLISDLVADGDVAEYRGRDRLEVPSRIIRRPMATITQRTWLWLVTATMVVYNGAYLDQGVAGRDSEGVPLSLVPVAPPRVSWLTPARPMIDGTEVDPDRLLWIPRMTFPTLVGDAAWAVRQARQVIAAAWAADSYRADFWQHGGAPTTVLTSDQYLNDTDAVTIADRWVERRAASPGKPAVLGKGTKAELFGADVATKGAADAGDRLGQAIARYLGVPAWLVNVATAAGSLVYQNVGEAGLDLVRYTLRPGYAGPIGDALSDVLPGDPLLGRRAIVGLDHLTHGSMLERFQAYEIATGHRPWLHPAEVRDELHLPVDASFSLDPAGTPAPALEGIAP